MHNKENKNKIILSGTVDKVLTATSVVVILENKLNVICYVCKKIRKYNLNIFPGDVVDVEMSPYDLKRGCIVFRHFNKSQPLPPPKHKKK